VAGAFVKHLLQVALEGVRAMDGLEQSCLQAFGFPPVPVA
jgi:hypothetical protein